MKTLYKSSRLIAAAIVGSLVLSGGAAVALTNDADHRSGAVDSTHYEDLGRFEVTPTKQTHVDSSASLARSATDLGRIVVTQRTAVFVPAV